MSFRYIGSKARIVDAIMDHVGEPDGGVFIDAFSGAGAVSKAAGEAGWPVHVNDHLISSAIMSFARVVSSDQVGFEGVGGYENAVSQLNMSESLSGFIWREYSPASIRHCSVSRMYFTEDNARKIDGVRNTIKCWKQQSMINEVEERILIADLMKSANRVANTAGTYGCFLSKWQRQSLEVLVLKPRELVSSGSLAKMTTVDVLDLECNPEDTVYLDPPYTKRQYAAYYHILETIALGDEPVVKGVCGIRPWQEKASDYSYKVRAANAIGQLINRLPAQRIFLSYSTEGHVPLATLSRILQGVGKVAVTELDQIGRYRPNRVASEAASEVGEVLFLVEKSTQGGRLAA